MLRITPALQHYAWGDLDSIPAMLGVRPSGEPVAEAWWGAHPAAPALVLGNDGPGMTLDAAIDADPVAALGGAAAAEHDGRLPYLLKVLAIAKPLSIQVHPSLAQARAGFAREDAEGIPLDSPDRVYRDRNHKPEMIVAITPMRILAGFRPVAELREDLDVVSDACISAAALADLGRVVAAADNAIEIADLAVYLRTAFTRMDDAAGVTDAVVAAAEAPGASDSLVAAAGVAEHFRGDGGVLVALAMNAVLLEPGEACFTGDGTVHSYQSGVGLEVMANSDNVVRAGLTPKHVDVDELLAIAHTAPAPAHRIPAERDGVFARYPAPSRAFGLATVSNGEAGFGAGPRIVLAYEGRASVRVEAGQVAELRQGQAVFVPHSDGDVVVDAEGSAAVVSVP